MTNGLGGLSAVSHGLPYKMNGAGVRQIRTKAQDLHSTLLKSLGEFSRRKCVLVLQKKLVVFCDKFQMAADASYPEVVDANRRKAKKTVKESKMVSTKE